MDNLLTINSRTIFRALYLLAILFIMNFQIALAEPPFEIPPGLLKAKEAQELNTPYLMEDPDVVGTAIGEDLNGNAVIKVFLAKDGVKGIPSKLNGISVIKEVTGEIVAYRGRPSSSTGVDPKTKQSTPVKTGTSGSWRYDLANGYCCSGTLGSLIQIGGNKYILSNYHVLYSDIVNGGNGRIAQSGDPVIQPGLVDTGCSTGIAQNVASLVSGGGSLPNSNIDAGIAQVISGMVDTTGSILNIGTISSATASPFINQTVKKMGRTTGLSKSSVSGLNATVSITYENECAGSDSFTKTFTGQIITKNSSCAFLNSGDSGSLMVQDVTTNPKAVGLLYAGSSTCNKFSIAVANPINEVLNYYGATMVGN